LKSRRSSRRSRDGVLYRAHAPGRHDNANEHTVDEPTIAIDVEVRRAFWVTMRELAARPRSSHW